MRLVYFGLAAVFTIAAIAMNWMNSAGWMTWVALIVAAIFLVLGFMKTAQEREPKPIVLTDEQKDTLRQLKRDGNESGAIRQVHLWFRDATPTDAQRIVRELQ